MILTEMSDVQKFAVGNLVVGVLVVFFVVMLVRNHDRSAELVRELRERSK